MEKVIPDDYVMRGPAFKAFSDEQLSDVPPAGYYKSSLFNSETVEGFDNYGPSQYGLVNLTGKHGPSTQTIILVGAGILALTKSEIDQALVTIHSLLVNQGVLKIAVPYYTALSAQEWLTKATELTFTRNRELWEIVSVIFYYEPEWNAVGDAAKEWARRHYFNVVRDMEVVMRAKK